MKVLVLNDTEREKGHLGCRLVMSNLKNILYQKGVTKVITVRSIDEHYDETAFNTLLNDIDLVIVNAEGTLHHNRGAGIYKQCIQAHKRKIKICMINAVWQSNHLTKKHLDLFTLIFVRESLSQAAISEDGRPDAIVVPDLSFYQMHTTEHQHKNYKATLFTDSVSPSTSKLLFDGSNHMNMPFYFMGTWHRKNFLKKFPLQCIKALILKKNAMSILNSEIPIMQSTHVITGRFHAACISLKYKIPFLTFSSNTHKIEGLLKDTGLSEEKLCLSKQLSINEFINKIEEFTENNFFDKTRTVENYVNEAPNRINMMFDQIIQS